MFRVERNIYYVVVARQCTCALGHAILKFKFYKFNNMPLDHLSEQEYFI